MTLKKYKETQAIKGQAIFEYFILTTVIVAVVLFFSSSKYFKDIKTSCETAFNNGVTKINGIAYGDTIGEIGGIK